MTQQDFLHLLDRILTRRKNRLRVLYALFLANETEPGRAVSEGELARNLAAPEWMLAEAIAWLAAAGYVEPTESAEPAWRLTAAGLATTETSLVRLDRETNEFPALRSILNSDYEPGPERLPGEPPAEA